MSAPLLNSNAFYDAGDVGCAGPALKEIARLLEELPAGAALEVRTASEAGRGSLHALCRLRGWTIEEEDAGPDRDRLLIRA